MLTETQQLNDLKDYKDKLFQNEGGRGTNSFGENGMHERFSKSGPLHPSTFCDVCRGCYSEYGCLLGYLLEAKRVLFSKFLDLVRS
jgi:hypothetical protein